MSCWRGERLQLEQLVTLTLDSQLKGKVVLVLIVSWQSCEIKVQEF